MICEIDGRVLVGMQFGVLVEVLCESDGRVLRGMQFGLLVEVLFCKSDGWVRCWEFGVLVGTSVLKPRRCCCARKTHQRNKWVTTRKCGKKPTHTRETGETEGNPQGVSPVSAGPAGRYRQLLPDGGQYRRPLRKVSVRKHCWLGAIKDHLRKPQDALVHRPALLPNLPSSRAMALEQRSA